MTQLPNWHSPINPRSLCIATFAAATMLLSACDNPEAKATAAPAASGPPITAALVIEKSVAETQQFSGRLEAINRVDIRPRVSGFLTSINFKPGAEVKKGDLLFVIDQRPYQAEADRAQAVAASALAKASLAKIESARAEKLLAEKAIAQREADEKTSALNELNATARAAQAAYEAAKLNLTFTRVLSPINGRVSKAEVTEGNLVDGTVILTTVVSANPIYATFDGDEDTFLRVARVNRKGRPISVKVGLANETGFPHQGKLEFVDNRVDPATGSVRLRAIFDNADDALAPGLFARVLIGDDSAAPKSTLIAEQAIGTDQNRKFVYVVNAESKAEYRAVELGPLVDNLRVVRSGLKPGEKIIVNGLQRARPGAPVTVQMVPMEADPNAPPAKGDAKAAAVAAK
ncbi:multidrug efflux system membrane fusion protein [Actimicrobium sp. GrIS 1.19]|nr:multidrug efflux system membrane fusion protein [Actimicrobium sp. GrIS 1.19]